ncbi:zinc metallochaperone AztD [Streptomyces albidoflavus]|uniref:zinc metallochaperone AztD n=1 Tax=Streptomyces TaxID=1883 RepID=UPI001BE63D02|nr:MULTISPECIES: zinc metallochaperone AztD [unclassified Streptomyces]MBT2877415.1 PQQ-binding-like beta-propeller repeat protein [Streptomyces sp. McG6]MBT2884721.1 PQQ-binding-like beta-propeller repeat protein [Streptomyces sp. McG5]MBT2890244.1 PQQ-binding-like beta-propeller repeat protein [Streptomyces sp. McG2]WSB12837.1 zinc metallochaperone AztD [Streptomyces albidoflavus]
MKNAVRPRAAAAAAALLTASALLTACGGDSTEPAAGKARDTTDAPAGPVKDPVVATYDGGLYVLDGATLKVAEDIPLKGFNRVNPAGDDRHVMVSTSTGFRVMDAVGGKLTDVEFEGSKPGHVVRHAGRTILFSDGTGEVTIFDPAQLGDGKPKSETYDSDAPHHGVAIQLAGGELVTTLGTEEKRTGIKVLDKNRKEITRNEKCPEVHGEAAAKDETVVVGCEDGVLVYKDGSIKKVQSPTEYGRIGNQAGSEESAVVLGDYKQDPDAELERPEQVSLIDTETGTMRLVDLGTSYTFRSLARGPHGEALVLGTDGRIHVIDPETGKVERKISVLDAWQEPLDWQQPRPALFVRDHTAYVSDPANKKLTAVDIESGKKLASTELEQAPNEVSGVDAH